MDLKDFDSFFRDAAVAGALGGIVRWIRLKEPWREGLLSVFAGAIIARYLYPFTLFMLDPALKIMADDPGARIGMAGFITGVMGMILVGLIIDFTKAKLKKEQG
jgi:hypothetical protein